MTEPLDDARGELLAVIDRRIADYEEIESRGDLTETGKHGLLVTRNIRRDMEFALRAAPARLDAEITDAVRACARSTLIGWRVELGDSIDFICDQISRKAALALSSTQGNSP